MCKLDFLDKYSERIQRTKETVKRVWNYEDIGFIPTLVYNYPHYNFSQELFIPWDKYILNKDLALKVKLNAIEEHLEVLDDLYIPYIDTFMGTPVIASIFGGEVTYFKDKDPWISEDVINNYIDIDNLKMPEINKENLAGKTLDFIEYWKLKTDGRLPISLPDIQGPASVAIDLMGAEKFYLGFIEDPKRIHNLLEIITEVIIDYLRKLYSIIEVDDGIYEWTGIFLPKGKGKVRLSEDNLIMISQEMYLEFLRPYHEKIFAEIGGGIIHWCGNGKNNFMKVLETASLMGIHNSSMGENELIIDQIRTLNNYYQKTGKKVLYFSSMVLPSQKKQVKKLIKKQKGYKGFINHIFIPTDDCGILFDFDGEKPGYEVLSDAPIEIIKNFIE